MPWGDPYGQAICDDCRATTKKSDYTGIESLRKAGAWCPKHTNGEVILCPICVVKEVGEDDVYQRWNGRISLGTTMGLTQVKARELFDRHWNPAPAEAAHATPPGNPAPGEAAHATPPGNPAPGEAALHDRRMGRRGLEVRIEQLEKEVEELKTLVKHQDAILKEVAAKVAMWSWFDGEGGNR